KQTLQDSARAIKDEVIKDLKEEAVKQLLGGKKDSAEPQKPLEDTKKKAEEAAKNTLKNLLNKKPVKDTARKE
ncbi:MAG TPA: hypothetical protein PLR74_05275, partial [Agriterribacter sp.]|nr:hypothetical protein [Agriterribacter sp.]